MYQFLRTFADSWGLLFMTLLFLGLIGWGWRPGGKAAAKRAKHSIFDHDDEQEGRTHG
ncbi:cbb3-type cytochrome oxidase subunit 3 [Sphingomicrobium aestuariivivum]|uniref:cbb3-type cytochrome oxidase subunit 3 n=1 Tax=Sphingomicrobium aestuariivivum TaxID=1582356 RepID=UPI001FD6E0F8|nr:cbb3-type cytochrome c oxidase subunit 3 [Sphingomicrobium aestuariivivum]MCJ8191290.1 cbb3-type cytochrome c oxidase subunit 3 [Sphingomicrobium aestuariivivum]